MSIDLGDIFGMPELLGGVFGDSLHEGFAQTGANSSFWPNRQNGTVGECVPKGGRSIGRQAVMLV